MGFQDRQTSQVVVHSDGTVTTIPVYAGTLPTSGGTALTDSASLRTALSDEIGTGRLFFGLAPHMHPNCTAWYRNFRASPWTDMLAGATLTEATNPCTVGTAINGRQTALFDGTNDRISDTTHTLAHYITSSAGTVIVVFHATAAAADVAANLPYTLPSLFCDTNVAFAVGYGAGGVRAGFYDGTDWNSAVAAAAINNNHFAAVRFNTTSIGVRVDSGSEVAVARAGAVGAMTNGIRVGASYNATAFYTGRIADVLTFNVRLSDNEINEFKAYFNAFYALSL